MKKKSKTSATRSRPGRATSGQKARGASAHIRSILVPIDFSTPSKQALEYAAAFAARYGAKLTLLHVVEPVATPDFAKSFPLLLEKDAVFASSRGSLAKLVKESGIRASMVEKLLVRQGRSFHEIVSAARTLKVDMIIISTHGYTGVKHVLLGSTTERVVRHATCPVLVLRLG